jgi:NAD+ synthetase
MQKRTRNMIRLQTKEELGFHTNYEDMYKNIQEELDNYLTRSNLKTLVLGVSGGIDSALCAALVKPVCDKKGVRLIGLSIPIIGNKKQEKKRAETIGANFCHEFDVIKLSSLYETIKDTFRDNHKKYAENDKAKKIRLGNIKARLRMIFLYDVAQASKGMVLSTDNYTEYLLGFWTLHGDVGDYGPFQNLWKTEVYGLAQWMVNNILTNGDQKKALQACIDAVPTDGLGITNSDLDQLECKTYAEVDQHLLSMFFRPEDTTGWPSTEYLAILKRHEASDFKRRNPYNTPRATILKDTDLPF